MNENNETIYYDPSQDKVLGVFGNIISVLSHCIEETDDEDKPESFDCCLDMTIEEYHRVWDNWIKGKRETCEFYGFFCGVMGYTHPDTYSRIDDVTINNPEFNGSRKHPEFITIRRYRVERFNDSHDFERG